jgi:hypothetical protein
LTAYVRVNAPRERGMRLRDLVLGKLLGITMLRATPEETPNDVQAVLNVLKNRRRRFKSRYYEVRITSMRMSLPMSLRSIDSTWLT